MLRLIWLRLTLFMSLSIAFISPLSVAEANNRALSQTAFLHAIPANEQINITAPIAMANFLKPINSKLTKTEFKGRLTFTPINKRSHLTLVEKSSVYLFEQRTRPQAFTSARSILPKIAFNFVQSAGEIIPLQRGLQQSQHPHWDFFIGIGNIWQQADTKNARVTMPFALIEKNQNCAHNGVLSFLLNETGKSSNFYYQISSETCQYFKANLWGKGQLTYQTSESLTKSEQAKLKINAKQKIAQHQQEKLHQLPTKSLQQLVNNHPQLDMNNLALMKTVNTQDMTNYGLVFNGVHYLSDCSTRFGDYPFCSQLILPSYSTAKSIFAGLAMLYLENIYPTIFNEKVADWVTQCKGKDWQGVTFSHLLNMATGNYDKSEHAADESAEHSQIFFKAKSQYDKTHYSCQQFKRKSQVGKKFVYHTSDTYLLGVALNNFLRAQGNEKNKIVTRDLFEDVFTESLWPMLKLSPVAFSTRKTLDKHQQAFTGYGLFFLRDDIAKLMNFITKENVAERPILNKKRLFTTLKKYSDADDMQSQIPAIHYKNGFWKQDVTKLLACKKETWLPYMLGYGGIAIVLASNNIQYYYFSDSDKYNWRAAIKELNKIAPLCR